MNTELQINRNTARWVSLIVGAVALIVGIIAVIIGPLNTAEVTTTYKTISYIAFGLAALGIVGFVMLDPQAISEAITGRSGQYTITTWLMALFFSAFVIAIFIILRQAAIKPLDLTEAQKYAMTDQTRQILQGLKQDVHVVAFYPEGQSDERKDAEVWLNQYASVSNGHVTFEFVDPDKNPGLATQLGMSRSNTMIFKSGDLKSEASFVSEQEMTSALLKVLSGNPRKAYVISGNGERQLQDFNQQGLSQMQSLLENANFKVEDLNLLEKKQIPDDANVVFLPGPTTSMLQPEVDALDAYLAKGGGVVVMIDAGQLTGDDPLIKYLGDKWGVTVRDDVVVDLVTAQFADALTPIIFNFDANHPVTKGMGEGGRRIVLSTARSLVASQAPPAGVTLTPLLMTANVEGGSWGETDFQNEQPALRFDDKDNKGPLNLAIAAENSSTKARLIVVGDTDYASNGGLQLDKFNGDFILNEANWLSKKEDLITLPPPSTVGTRSLDKLTSLPLVILISISSACLIPLVLLVAGISVWVVRRRRR